ncbi:MAG TPA: substrate-binding domain-containing protein [Polyangia bacterium]
MVENFVADDNDVAAGEGDVRHNGNMRRRGVLLFLRSLDNDYQQHLRDDAIAAAPRFGYTLTVHSAHNDAARQAAQIRTALGATNNGGDEGNEIAAVMVSPVREELEEVARFAIERGVGWAQLNREAPYIPSLREQAGAIPAFCVSPNQIEIGRLQAAQAKKLAPKGGHIITITGPRRTSSSRMRIEGMWSELGPTYPLTLLECDWTTEGARLILDRWLRDTPGSVPCLVAAQNDEMALGARQALRDAALARGPGDLETVPVIGVDGSPGFGQRMVREHRVAATITLPSASSVALEHLAAYHERGVMPPPRLFLPVASFPPVPALAPPAKPEPAQSAG